MKCLEGGSEADISDLHNLFVWPLNLIFVIQIQSPWKIHSLIKFDTNSHLMCLLSQSKSKFESKVQFQSQSQEFKSKVWTLNSNQTSSSFYF